MKDGRYALRNLLNAKVFDYKTGEYLFRIDYGTTVENEWKANQTMVRGGDGNPIRVVYNDGKESTLKISTEIFSMKQLAMLNGADIVKGAKNLYRHDILTILEDTSTTPATLYVQLTKPAVDMNGDGAVGEDDVVVVLYSNGVQGDPVTVDAVTNTTTGGTTVTRVELSGTNAVKGNEVEVVYQWTTDSTAQTMQVRSDKFPQYVKIVGDSLFADEVEGDFVAGQVTFHKAKVQPNYKLNYSPTGNATQLDMTFDILAANIAGKSIMSDLTLYDNPDA